MERDAIPADHLPPEICQLLAEGPPLFDAVQGLVDTTGILGLAHWGTFAPCPDRFGLQMHGIVAVDRVALDFLLHQVFKIKI